MPRFAFRLESVLKLRKSREEEALRVLGGAQRAYQASLAQKEALLAQLETALLRREKLGERAVGIDAFRIEQSYIEGTKQRITRADHAIFRASKLVEKALRAYLNARKQSRMLETLKEKDYKAFRKEQAKIEARWQDDLTIMRFRMREESA